MFKNVPINLELPLRDQELVLPFISNQSVLSYNPLRTEKE